MGERRSNWSATSVAQKSASTELMRAKDTSKSSKQ